MSRMRSSGPPLLFIWVVCCTAFPRLVIAQDTVQISDVRVTARKTVLAFTGKRTQRMEPALMELFRYNAVSDLLSFSSGTYVRSYGNGGIAMAGLRGSSAEQSAVLWNGFNLQNSMLGVSDLSMVPASLFESVSVEYGGTASMWGSGAVGGCIHLNNGATPGKIFRVTTGLAAGSIGQFNTSGIITAGTNRLVNTTKIYTQRSSNRFGYHNPVTGTTEVMKNAGLQGHGLMNEFRVRTGRNGILSLNAWLSGSSRRQPGYDPAVPVKQFQDDRALRFQGSWMAAGRKGRTSLRTVYFNETVGFTDSIAQIFDRNTAQTFMTDAEHFRRWGKGHEMHAGMSFLHAAGRTDHYQGQGMLRRISVLAGNRFSFTNDKLFVLVNGRAEHFSGESLPVTGNLAVECLPRPWLKTGITLSTTYRQPTLNEMFWLPGGNRSLRPERGAGGDATITFSHRLPKLSFETVFAAYTRTVTDWIVWVPVAGSQPSPVNILEVWSRGMETSWLCDYRHKKATAGFLVTTSYVLSTVEKTHALNSGSVGMQLIYTPRYQAGGHVYAGYARSRIYLLCQYAGYRFTTSDNSSWLEPYTLVSLRATQALSGAGLSFSLFAACNNLLDTDYLIIAGRPMPRRNYEIGITIHFQKNQ